MRSAIIVSTVLGISVALLGYWLSGGFGAARVLNDNWEAESPRQADGGHDAKVLPEAPAPRERVLRASRSLSNAATLVQGRIVDGASGKPLRATVHGDRVAIWTDAQGCFALDLSTTGAEVLVESPGYESRRIRTSELAQRSRAITLALSLKGTSLRFEYESGKPAFGARVYGLGLPDNSSTRPNIKLLGLVDEKGRCAGVRVKDIIWAEDGSLASKPLRVKTGIDVTVLADAGIPVKWVVRGDKAGQRTPAAEFSVQTPSISIGYTLTPDSCPNVLPRMSWCVTSAPQSGFSLDIPASSQGEIVQDQGSRIGIASPRDILELRLILKATLGSYIVLKDRESGDVIDNAVAILSIYSPNNPGRLSVRPVTRSSGDQGRIWWSGRFGNILTQIKARATLILRAPGYRDLIFANPQQRLVDSSVVHMNHLARSARLELRTADSAPYRGFAEVRDKLTGDVVFTGNHSDSLLFPWGGQMSYTVTLGNLVLSFKLDRELRASLVLPATGTVRIDVPSNSKEDLVLWGASKSLERTTVLKDRGRDTARVILFERVPVGNYELTPRDRYRALLVNKGRRKPNVAVSQNHVTRILWRETWGIRSAVHGRVGGIDQLAPGSQVQVWPYYGGSDFTIPSGKLRGLLFPVDAEGLYSLIGLSGTMKGVYLVEKGTMGRGDALLAFSGYPKRVTLDLRSVSIKTALGKEGWIGFLDNLGPLRRDGGARGGRWHQVDASGSTLIRNIPSTSRRLVYRYREANGRVKRIERLIDGGVGRQLLVDLTEDK